MKPLTKKDMDRLARELHDKHTALTEILETFEEERSELFAAHEEWYEEWLASFENFNGLPEEPLQYTKNNDGKGAL